MPSKKQRRQRKQNANANVSHRTVKQQEQQQASEGEEEEHVEENSEEKLYKIANSDILGRYIVASRDLAAGVTIICERPLVVGPCSSADPVCLGCYKPVTLNALQYRCGQCQWPMCGEQCVGKGKQATGHGEAECELLKQSKTATQLRAGTAVENIRNLYELIVILRILLMKDLLPDTYATIMRMESHLTLRRENKELWQYYQLNIVVRLRDYWHLGDKFTEEEIHTVCGILDVNCFEIGQNPVKARSLYPTAFYLAHDCCPNTAHTDDPQTFALNLHSSRSIRKNETITLSYAYTLQGTLKRREFINTGKLFWCRCARCSDPKELGTDCSAIICTNCKKGFLRSTDPLEQKANWKCDGCEFKRTAKDVNEFLTKSNDALESADVHNILELENFIKSYEKLLHKNHYLLLSAKYTLCQTYGRLKGYLIHEMSLEDIKRKERYCREFLEIVDIIEPGLTRLRGLIMYELHAPIMMIAQLEMQRGQIRKNDFQRRIKEVVHLLRESRNILLLEPAGSSEHEMGLAAASALESMGQ